MENDRIPFCIFRERSKAFLDTLGVVEDKWWYAQQYFHYLQDNSKGLEWDFQELKSPL